MHWDQQRTARSLHTPPICPCQFGHQQGEGLPTHCETRPHESLACSSTKDPTKAAGPSCASNTASTGSTHRRYAPADADEVVGVQLPHVGAHLRDPGLGIHAGKPGKRGAARCVSKQDVRKPSSVQHACMRTHPRTQCTRAGQVEPARNNPSPMHPSTHNTADVSAAHPIIHCCSRELAASTLGLPPPGPSEPRPPARPPAAPAEGAGQAASYC